jgi:N-acetylglucosaminyldiphosphoundecaprenol N-acetyl-beta-D-mannosaminyltransferase
LSPPVRPLEEFDNGPILEAIRRARPDILLVAFGSPKQEKWISQNRGLLNVPVAIGVGGSLDFLAKSISRAPAWMQRHGLEWVYRMWQEPQRLAPRYLADAFWMARYLSVELSLSLIGRPRNRGLRLSADAIGPVRIFQIGGAMTGPELPKFGSELFAEAVVSGPVVLDLTETSYIGADGLWTLVGLLRQARKRGTDLWIAGLSPSLIRTFRVAHFEGLIRSAASALDAVRQSSRHRLRINLELGESWATCRMSGDIPVGARSTLEQICQSLRLGHPHIEFDTSEMTGFEPGTLMASNRSGGRGVYSGDTRVRAAGAT